VDGGAHPATFRAAIFRAVGRAWGSDF
jgi:hypothetical protein